MGLHKTEDRGASGKMELRHEYWEHSYGHDDRSKSAYLIGEGSSVVLLAESTDHNAITASFNSGERRYRVDVDELIAWIKENGEEVKRKPTSFLKKVPRSTIAKFKKKPAKKRP